MFYELLLNVLLQARWEVQRWLSRRTDIMFFFYSFSSFLSLRS